MRRIKSIAFLLTFLPILVFSQTRDSVIVYKGNASFENKIIDFSNQNLSKIPSRAINDELEVLILDNNNLTELPNWIGNITNLRSLSVRNNNLKQINILIHCTNLEELYLSGNQNLVSLPNLSRCEKLKIIDVVGTQINALPMSIRGMENIGYFKYSIKK